MKWWQGHSASLEPRPNQTVNTLRNCFVFISSRRFQSLRVVRGHFSTERFGRETIVRHNSTRENGTVRRSSRGVHKLLDRPVQKNRHGGV